MENINSCPLCLEDIEGEYIDKTGHCDCKIKYHKECFILLQKKFICPICRIKKNKSSFTLSDEYLFCELEQTSGDANEHSSFNVNDEYLFSQLEQTSDNANEKVSYQIFENAMDAYSKGEKRAIGQIWASLGLNYEEMIKYFYNKENL